MSTPTNTLTIPLRKVLDLQAALNALDGRQEPCEVTGQDGKTVKSVNTVPYRFSGGARIAVARWLARLAPEIEAFKKAHDGLVKQHSDPKAPGAVAPGNVATFMEQLNEHRDALVTIELPKIKLADLNIEDNRIAPSILATLDPILAD